MDQFDRALGYLASALGRAGELALLGLIMVTLFEVGSRYLFNRPSLWAYDIAYMLSGAMVMLGAAFALRRNAHVRIDILVLRLPPRWQQGLQVLIYLCLFLPALGVAGWAALGRAISAWQTGQLEQVSAWAPQVWPFYSIITLGLLALWLEAVAAVLRHIQAWRRREPLAAGGM